MDNPSNTVNKTAFLAMMVALILATNYAMFGVANVKLMDMLVFLTGFWLGPWYGAAAGVLSWSVYGTFNPLGFSLLTLATVAPMEAVYGVFGGFIGRRVRGPFSLIAWSFSVAGLLTTLAYDVVTNAVTGAIFYSSALTGVVVGIPFSLVHIASNLVQFSLLAPSLVVKTSSMIPTEASQVG